MTKPAPRTIGGYECHELAEAFPLMDARNLASLADSIKVNGLRRKPLLLDGKILDGRNRCLALLQLGQELVFEAFDAAVHGDPVQFVWDENGERRDLSVTQRILAAKRLEQLRRKLKGANKKQRKLDLADPADKALLSSVEQDGVPELVQAHKDGLVPELAWAAEIAKLSPEQQRAEVERIQRMENAPAQRAASKARTVFAVMSEDALDSVWDARNKAEAAAAGLTEELRQRFVVHEFALNEVDGMVS